MIFDTITLTAINTVIAVVTLPLVTGLAIAYYDRQDDVTMPLVEIVKVFALILLPVGIGMIVNARAPGFARRMDKPVRIGSAVILAILVPDFDRIMSLMGAVACFTICIMLPAAFHLKLFGDSLTKAEKARDWTLVIVSGVMAVVSTAFNFVPKEKLGL